MAGANTFPHVIPANDLADLASIHVAELDFGTIVWVESVNAQFTLTETPLTPPDGVNVVAPLPQAAVGKPGAAWQKGGGGGGSSLIVEQNAVPLPVQPKLNFVGSGFSLSNNVGNSSTDVAAVTQPTFSQGSTIAGLAALNGQDANSIVFVFDTSAEYRYAPAGSLPTDGWTVVDAPVGQWNLQGSEMTVQPLGGGADDWPRLFDVGGAGTAAGPAGDTMTLASGTWSVQSGLLSIPDHFTMRCEPRVAIVSTLTQAGGFPGHYVFMIDAPSTVDAGTLDATPAVGASQITVAGLGAGPFVNSYVQLVHGLSCEVFQILAATPSGGDFVLTLDHPTALPWASTDLVSIYPSRPIGVELDFSGTVTGTGDQIVQIVRTERFRARGFIFNASGGLPKAVFGWDLGCRDCSLEDAVIDCLGSDGTHGQSAVFIQSGEQMYVSRTTVSNAAFDGIILLDCVDSGLEDVHADSCSTGFSISSFGIGPDTKQSFGSYWCSIRRAMATSCAVGFYVAQTGLATGSALSDVTALACTSFGIAIGPGATDVDVQNADVRFSTQGLAILGGAARVSIRSLWADGCTALALNINGADVLVDGMRAVVNYAGGNGVITLQGAGPWTFKNLRLTQQNAGGYLIYCVGVGEMTIDDAKLLGNPAVGIWVNAIGAVATISNTVVVAGQGLVVPNGATVILGENVDLSGCASPFSDGGSPPMGVVKGHFSGNSVITMTTADYTAAWADYAVESVQIAGTLGLPRNLTFPGIRMTWNIVNGTDQIVTVQAATGTGVAIVSGGTATVTYDGTNFVAV